MCREAEPGIFWRFHDYVFDNQASFTTESISRASFYRFNEDAAKPDRDMDLRDAIQRIALEWPSYGRPRITAELRRRG